MFRLQMDKIKFNISTKLNYDELSHVVPKRSA